MEVWDFCRLLYHESGALVTRISGHMGRVWWLTTVIPTLWEAEADGSQGQEFKISLVNMVKPHPY